ncbi:MAG: tetratricopeptide repeat protein [Gemmatimonadota bacterium]|nr:tetratricopeptide repeat protein [Gemmatimonadota bacterium]
MADPGRLEELKRKFEENPKRYFAPLANEYRKAGEPDRAIELCRTYLPQQPTHMSGYIVYGQALHDAGRADESAAVFRQALTLDPENIIALRHLGDIARDSGDRDGALRWYGKVLELDPRNEEIASYIGSLTQPVGRTSFSGPERQAPPSVRPEPEPDESAVRLGDLISEPDVAMPSAFPAWQDEFEGTAGNGSRFGTDEPFEPFGASEWPSAAAAGASAGDAASAQADVGKPVLEGPWGSPGADDASGDATVPKGDGVDSAPLGVETAARSGQGGAPEAARVKPASPFVTETMAELYVQQGLHGEAVAIYRELVLLRDDPRLRQRISELEAAQPTAPPAETVREFFARIGATQPRETVVGAAAAEKQGGSPLATLFGGLPVNSDDASAAERLSGAFGASRAGHSNS